MVSEEVVDMDRRAFSWARGGQMHLKLSRTRLTTQARMMVGGLPSDHTWGVRIQEGQAEARAVLDWEGQELDQTPPPSWPPQGLKSS